MTIFIRHVNVGCSKKTFHVDSFSSADFNVRLLNLDEANPLGVAFRFLRVSPARKGLISLSVNAGGDLIDIEVPSFGGRLLKKPRLNLDLIPSKDVISLHMDIDQTSKDSFFDWDVDFDIFHDLTDQIFIAHIKNSSPIVRYFIDNHRSLCIFADSDGIFSGFYCKYVQMATNKGGINKVDTVRW